MLTKKATRKFVLLAAGLFLTLLILTGCSASIALNIEPEPIEFTEDDTTETITISLRTSGVGNVRVDELVLLIFDEDENEIFQDELEVGEESFIVPGVSFEEDYELDVCDIIEYKENEEVSEEECQKIYNDELAGYEYELKILLQGSITSTVRANIIFK